MKKILFLIITFVCVATASELVWLDDILTAKEKAMENNQTIMVFVESKSCRWCKKMERVTFSDDEVISKLNQMVLVRLMREDKKALEDLPHVKWVPTIFFLAPNLDVEKTVTGYFDVADFLSYLNDIKRLK